MLFLILQQILNSSREAEISIFQGLWGREMFCAKVVVVGEALNQQNKPNPTAKEKFCLTSPKSAFITGRGNPYGAPPCVQIASFIESPTMCQSSMLSEGRQ